MICRARRLSAAGTMSQRFGRSELARKIAQGGMGWVFLGSQRGPGGFERRVALKRLLPEIAQEPGLVELFLEEARIAATLNHPNVCQLIDFGSEDGRYYIAME